ncbi:MAG: response regulator [Acidobacteriota bacterium]
MNVRKLRTVIADDDALAVRSLLRRLAPFEEEIEVIGIVENGRKGLELIDRLRPELAFVEVELPLLDGFEMCRQLSYKPLIVFMTAARGERLKAQEAGGLALLCKPIGLEEITSLMNRVRGALKLPDTLKFRPGRD